jgi:NADPH-dependent ferric siderophore reductase
MPPTDRPPTQYGTVDAVERLAPSMIRIVFGGPGLAGFSPTDATDQYVNAAFVPEGAPYSVPFDLDEVRELDPALRPRHRRYTIRAWNPDTRQVTIDFVAHGDVGYAGRWAQRATVGDRLQMAGPSGNYRPDPTADWHLLVGDESALPAIAASLDALDGSRPAVVVAVVDSPDHEVALPQPGGVDVHWLHRCTSPVPEDLLADAVAGLDWLDGRADVFVHGEAAEVRAVRRFLLAERGIDRAAASISPYWRRDHTDEAWREVKRQWLAEQEQDV